VHQESIKAKNGGDMEEALRLKSKSQEMWDKAEGAYRKTKDLAPNYVQTHHQMGLLYTKRAEQALQWGESQKANEYYQKALENFRLYHRLDPVFPPNFDRMIQILLMDQKFHESEELYKEAIYYNEVVSKLIRDVPDPNVSNLCVSLAKVYYTEATRLSPDPFHPVLSPVEEALKYFKKATEARPKNEDAWKGLGFILDKMGKKDEAQAAWRKALEISPNDPDLKANIKSG
jgi:superkiller protein 3